MNLQVHQNYRGALPPSRSPQGIFLNLAPDINELLPTDYFHFLQAVTDSNVIEIASLRFREFKY